MCGFAGFSYNDEKLLKKISKTLKQRAIDYDYFYHEDSLSFYHAHLSISDLDKNTSQPLIYNNLVIGLVGEIYNKQFLLNLSGIKGDEKDFTELQVIGFCFEKIGEDFINYVNGEFSIFIYNKFDNNYFLFRDRWGVNNAYYRIYNGYLFFASEIKSLVFDKAVLNKNSFIEHMVFQFGISPNTIVKDVFSLRPGTYLKFTNGKIELNNFKEYVYQENNNTIIEAIENSVKRRIPYYQDKIFISLSGGPDSNIIMYFLKKYYKGEIVAYSFVTNENQEEIEYAIRNTKFLGIKHLIINMNSYVFNNLEEDIYNHEGLVILPNLGKILLDKYPEFNNIKVEFGGDGKEELILGNDHYPYKEIYSRYEYFYKKGMIKKYNINQEFLNREMFDYNLQMIDKISLRNGLERRLPFTDYELLKFYKFKNYKPIINKFLNENGLYIVPLEFGYNLGIGFKNLYDNDLIKIKNILFNKFK